MTLGLTQPLTEMSTSNISWGGKGGRCVGLTTLQPSCFDCLEIWRPPTSRNPQGLSRPLQALLCHFVYIFLDILLDVLNITEFAANINVK